MTPYPVFVKYIIASREEGKASRSHLSPPRMRRVPAQPAGWSDFSENQIPDAVAERETAALELGLGPGLRSAGITGSGVAQRRLGGEHLQHLPGVFLPVGAGMHAGAALHSRGKQRDEGRLDEAPLVMALLRPGVGKEQVHAVQRLRGDHLLHHLDRV